MVERMRRLRLCLANTGPGRPGRAVRPNYVGPLVGLGLTGGLDERDESPGIKRVKSLLCGQSLLSGLLKRGPGVKEIAAVERRKANALRHWACAARRRDVTRAFRRSAPSRFEGASLIR